MLFLNIFIWHYYFPADIRRWPNADLVLDQH